MTVTALTPQRRLAPPLDYALVGAIIALALFGSATPTPLYADYAARWDFSTPVLTAFDSRAAERFRNRQV